MSHMEGDLQFFPQAVEKMQKAKRVWAAGDTHHHSVARVENSMFGDGLLHLAEDVHTLQLAPLFLASHYIIPCFSYYISMLTL